VNGTSLDDRAVCLTGQQIPLARLANILIVRCLSSIPHGALAVMVDDLSRPYVAACLKPHCCLEHSDDT